MTEQVNKSSEAKRLQLTAWLLVAVVSIVTFAAWLEDFGWQLPPLTVYVIFPVLGLLAYGLMWSQYVVGFLQDSLKVPAAALRPYFRITGWAVLLLICLHPGLLIFQRFLDGFGLPPGSYKSFVAPGLGWLTLLGTVCLLAFLAYELYRWFDDRAWWPYVLTAVDLAMLGIFYHGLRLGNQTGHGWFNTVWWFYGLTLAAILIHKYALKFRPQKDR